MPGDSVVVCPLAGVAVRTRSELTAVKAAVGVDEAEASCARSRFRPAQPLTGCAAPRRSTRCVIAAGVSDGLNCFMSATTAATLGAAEDVPKNAGRFCE